MKKVCALMLIFASCFNLSAMFSGSQTLQRIITNVALRNVCMRTQRCLGSESWLGGDDKKITDKNLAYVQCMIREGKLDTWKIALDAGTTRAVVDQIKKEMQQCEDLRQKKEKCELLAVYHEINEAPQETPAEKQAGYDNFHDFVCCSRSKK